VQQKGCSYGKCNSVIYTKVRFVHISFSNSSQEKLIHVHQVKSHECTVPKITYKAYLLCKERLSLVFFFVQRADEHAKSLGASI